MLHTRPHRTWFAQATAVLLPLVVAAAALLGWWLDPIPLQNLRLAQFDQFQRWQARQPSNAPVRVVDIDEASLQAFGQWPWPRTRLAELITRLREAGVAVVAFDVLLPEPDRTAPASMAQLWQQPQLQPALRALPDPDQVLAQTLAQGGVVLGASLSHHQHNPATAASPESAAPAPALKSRVILLGPGDLARVLPGFDAAVWPLPELGARADGLGALNFMADADGVLRRVPLLLRHGEQLLPSLSAETLRLAQGASNYLVNSTEAGVASVRIGALTVPTNAQAEVWLNYRDQVEALVVPATQVLGGQLPPQAWRGHLVVVGSSAAGLMDVRSNPLGQLMPGVQAHAMALGQMISGRLLQRPSWARGAEALALVLGAWVAGVVALRAPIRSSALVSALLLVGLAGGAWLAFVQAYWLLDVANPGLAVLLSFGLASGVRHRLTEREQRWIREAFSRYVSPNRVAHLMAHPEQLALGGERRVCSFVFTDLAGFTSMVEGSDPARVVPVVNAYLDAMLAMVFKHEGTLDRFMGDALVVMFSAPVVQADHRQRALDCALDMHAFSAVFCRQQQAQGLAWGHTRIGVHCGEVIVGNFGGQTLFDYRALGDPINTAARLESVNKHLGTRVCVSQAILAGCPDAQVRPVGRLRLQGKTEVLHAYEPLAAMCPGSCPDPKGYALALQHLARGESAQALALLEALAQRYPQDPLLALHLTRLREGATDDLIVPHTK